MNDLNLNVLLTFAAYAVITGLLNLLLSERSRVDAWAESKPKLAAALKVLRAIGLDPWHLVSAVSLFFKGKLPQPKEPEAKSGKAGPLLVLLVACAALSQQACSAAQWQQQAEFADRVAVVSNTTVLPMLQQAYDTGGMAVIALQPDRESAAAAIAEYRRRWAPVWSGYDALKAAHDAWQDTISAKGDPMPSAVAARKAFCELRVAALEVSLKLPDFPVLRCQ